MTWIYLGSIQKDIIHAYCKASLSWCINWKRKGRTSCRLREVLVSRSKQYESICALTATMQLPRLVALGIPIWVGSANTCFSVSIGFRSWERGACWITPSSSRLIAPATGSEYIQNYCPTAALTNFSKPRWKIHTGNHKIKKRKARSIISTCHRLNQMWVLLYSKPTSDAGEYEDEVLKKKSWCCWRWRGPAKSRVRGRWSARFQHLPHLWRSLG